MLSKLLFSFGIFANSISAEKADFLTAQDDKLSGYSMLNVDFLNELQGGVYFSCISKSTTQLVDLDVSRQESLSLFSKKI